MSLVNDALKRAKEAHDRQAGSPMRGAPLHTAEPTRGSRMGIIALLAFVLAFAVAGGGIWYWQKHQSLPFFKTKTEEPAKPTYKIIIGANPDAKPKPAPATPVAVATIAVQPTTPAPKPEIIPAPAPAAPPAPTAPPLSPPIALKLQGILYSATKPAAILNGRTVFIGDAVGGMTISSIQPDRITITYSNQPIVIRMP